MADIKKVMHRFIAQKIIISLQWKWEQTESGAMNKILLYIGFWLVSLMWLTFPKIILVKTKDNQLTE